MVRFTEGGRAVFLLLVPVLDLEAVEMAPDDGGGGTGHLGLVRGLVPVPEEHAREAATDRDGGTDAIPRGVVVGGRQEGQDEVRVDEVAGRDVEPGQVGDARLEPFEVALGCQAPQRLDALRGHVRGQHAPAAPQQLTGIATGPAAEVDRESRRLVRVLAEGLGRLLGGRPGGALGRDLVVVGPVGVGRLLGTVASAPSDAPAGVSVGRSVGHRRASLAPRYAAATPRLNAPDSHDH